jgi:PII-like signaling protein
MASDQVTMVRIYLREGEHVLPALLRKLHDEEKVAGVTVTRGIAGYSSGGQIHVTSMIDLSLDLPLIVEFYDRPERTEAVVASLKRTLALPHIVTWPATVCDEGP